MTGSVKAICEKGEEGLSTGPLSDREADLRKSEQALWEAIPAEKRRVLEVDRSGEGPTGQRGGSDIFLLSYLANRLEQEIAPTVSLLTLPDA